MSRFLTLRNIVIALSVILVLSVGFFIYGSFLQRQSPPTPASSPPSSSTGSTQTGTLIPTSSSLPPTLSPPVSPTETSVPLAPLVIPPGFRFPEDASPQYPTPLEPIPPSLTPDPQTKRMPVPDKDLLYFQLSKSFQYDPASGDVIEDTRYQVQPIIIDFGHFDPESLNVRPGDNLLWFNQNTLPCQLKTDPKSPDRIDQKIDSQKTLILQLYKPGIYLFFCQGLPGSTQTIVVS